MENFKYLKDNKALLIAQKKSVMKKADAFSYIYEATTKTGEIIKAVDDMPIEEIGTIKVKVVINTTNIVDSHNDCHIPNIWKKTLQEKKLIYLLNNHKLCFDEVISDEVKAYTELITFKQLGIDLIGTTEALIFEATISAERNKEMFKAYLKGWVKNHSVGMQYVQIVLCINSEEKYYQEEKANWDKYYPMVANKSVADELGAFWAVIEAKLIEGSAVVIGSNTATPTISVEQVVPESSTQQEDSRKSTILVDEINDLLTEQFKKIKF